MNKVHFCHEFDRSTLGLSPSTRDDDENAFLDMRTVREIIEKLRAEIPPDVQQTTKSNEFGTGGD
jgi:hypothetical protein